MNLDLFACRHARDIGTALGTDGLVVVFCGDCRHQFTKPVKGWRGSLLAQHLRNRFKEGA